VRPLRVTLALLYWLSLPVPGLLACVIPDRPGADRRLLYTLDPAASEIRFDADARLHTFAGTVGTMSGQVRLAGIAPPTDVDGCVEIDAASLTTGITRRDATMRSHHLHSDRFPTILFRLVRLDEVVPAGANEYGVTLRGTLTLHGVTSPLAAPARATLAPNRLTVAGTARLRLSTFQIPIPSFLFIAMRDEVVVTFAATWVAR